MTGTCKDCRFWRSFGEWWETEGVHYYDTLEDVDDWGQHSMKLRYGTCMKAESNGEKPEFEDTLAFAVDGENYTASLETSPDYGCNQHQNRGA